MDEYDVHSYHAQICVLVRYYYSLRYGGALKKHPWYTTSFDLFSVHVPIGVTSKRQDVVESDSNVVQVVAQRAFNGIQACSEACARVCLFGASNTGSSVPLRPRWTVWVEYGNDCACCHPLFLAQTWAQGKNQAPNPCLRDIPGRKTGLDLTLSVRMWRGQKWQPRVPKPLQPHVPRGRAPRQRWVASQLSMEHLQYLLGRLRGPSAHEWRGPSPSEQLLPRCTWQKG